MTQLRRPGVWSIVITLAGLASSPAAHYRWEGAVFVLGGIAVVVMELLQRPRWRSTLIWGWLLDATFLTIAGLMFRVSSPSAPSGATTLVLSTAIGFGVAWGWPGTDAERSPDT